MNKNTKFFILSTFIIGILHGLILLTSFGKNRSDNLSGKVQIKLISVDQQLTSQKQSKEITEKQSPQSDEQNKIESKTLSVNSKEVNLYLQKFQNHINKYVQYPAMGRRLGESGSVDVRFEFKADGRIDFRIIKKSEFSRLNDSVTLGLVRATPFPKPPKDFPARMFTHQFLFNL